MRMYPWPDLNPKAHERSFVLWLSYIKIISKLIKMPKYDTLILIRTFETVSKLNCRSRVTALWRMKAATTSPQLLRHMLP
jgi:hypothetical protein